MKFADGKRYEDFNAGTDKIAEYGLAALVGGVVLKKAGFFATIAVVLLKSIKGLVILAFAGIAAAGRFFWRKKPKPQSGAASS